jgi:hypothetical protein
MPSGTAEYPFICQLPVLTVHLPWYEHVSGITRLCIGLPIASPSKEPPKTDAKEPTILRTN